MAQSGTRPVSRPTVGGRLQPNQGQGVPHPGVVNPKGGDDSSTNQAAEIAAINNQAGNVVAAPSLYLQNITTPQGNVQVQFAPRASATYVGLAPVAITKNQSFTQPLNSTVNGFTTTGSATYSYQLSGNQLQPTTASANGIISYQGTPVATLTANGPVAIPGATVAEAVTGNVGGRTQNIGTLNFVPSVSNGTLTLGYQSFTPATVTVNGSSTVNVGGRGYTVGFSYPETSSFNASTNTISFAPSALFATNQGNQPLPSVPLVLGSINTPIGSQGVSIASNVLVSPFAGAQSVTLGLIGKGVITPQQSITYLQGSAALNLSSTYALTYGGATLTQTYGGPTFVSQPSVSSQSSPNVFPTSTTVGSSLFGGGTKFTSKSIPFGSIGLATSSSSQVTFGLTPGNAFAPGIVQGGTPLDTIVQTLGTSARFGLAEYETNVVGGIASIFNNAPQLNVNYGFGGGNVSVTQAGKNIAIGTLNLIPSILGLAVSPEASAQALKGLPGQLVKNPVSTVEQLIPGVIIGGVAESASGSLVEGIDVATFGEAPPRTLPQGTVISDIVVRSNPIVTGQSGTLEVVNPSSSAYEFLTSRGANPISKTDLSVAQEGFGSSISINGKGYTVVIGGGNIGYNINAETEGVSLAYQGAAISVGDFLQPSSSFTSAARLPLATTTYTLQYATPEFAGTASLSIPTTPKPGLFQTSRLLSATSDLNVNPGIVEFEGISSSFGASALGRQEFGIAPEAGASGRATTTIFGAKGTTTYTAPFLTPPKFVFDSFNEEGVLTINIGTIAANREGFSIEPLNIVNRNIFIDKDTLSTTQYLFDEGKPFNPEGQTGTISRILSRVPSPEAEPKVEVFRGTQFTQTLGDSLKTSFQLEVGPGKPDLSLGIPKIEFEPLSARNGKPVLLVESTAQGVEIRNFLQPTGSRTLDEAFKGMNEADLMARRDLYLKATPAERQLFGLEYPERVVPKNVHELTPDEVKDLQQSISRYGLADTKANIQRGTVASPRLTQTQANDLAETIRSMYSPNAKIESFPVSLLKLDLNQGEVQPTFNFGAAFEQIELNAKFQGAVEPLTAQDVAVANYLQGRSPTKPANNNEELFAETTSGQVQKVPTQQQQPALKVNFAVPDVSQLRLPPVSSADRIFGTGIVPGLLSNPTRATQNQPRIQIGPTINRIFTAVNTSQFQPTRTNFSTRTNLSNKTNLLNPTKTNLLNPTRTSLQNRTNFNTENVFKTSVELKTSQTTRTNQIFKTTTTTPTYTPPSPPGINDNTTIPTFNVNIDLPRPHGRQRRIIAKSNKLGYTPDISHILTGTKAPSSRIRKLQGFFGVSRGI